MRNLLKYDFKYTWRIWWIVALVTLVMTVIATISLRSMVQVNTDYYGSSSELMFTGDVLSVLGIFSIVVFVLSLIALGVLTFILVMYRYYKNFFTDEGYLTFTLPVKEGSLLMSKCASGFVWIFGTGLIEFAMILIFALFGTSENGMINHQVLHALGEFFPVVYSYIGGTMVLYVIEFILLVIASSIFSMLLGYISITIGSIIAKKNKFLAGAGIFVGTNIVISIASNIATTILFAAAFSSDTLTDEQVMAYIGIILAVLVVVTLAACVGLYFATRGLIRRKLNLA